MNTTTTECKPGYYVNDEWFGERIAQARARARHLANELPGKMEVIHQSPDGELLVVATYTPINQLVQTTRHYKPAFENRQGRPPDQDTSGEGRS